MTSPHRGVSCFKAASDKLTEHGEPINQVLEVEREDVIFELYELPPAS